MQIKCSLCGRVEEITKIHKDYDKLAKKVTSTYFCELCNNKLKFAAKETQKPAKPV